MAKEQCERNFNQDEKNSGDTPESFSESQLREMYYEAIKAAVEEVERINKIIYILQDKDLIAINILPAKDLSSAEKISLINDGLKKIAEIVKASENISRVLAHSLLVKKHPKFIESLGFTVIDGQEGLALMPRDVLIQKYSKNQKT